MRGRRRRERAGGTEGLVKAFSESTYKEKVHEGNLSMSNGGGGVERRGEARARRGLNLHPRNVQVRRRM